MKVKFTRDYTVKDETGTTYTKGQVVNLSGPSANHFIKRGAAVEYTEPPPTPKRGPGRPPKPVATVVEDAESGQKKLDL
jgi:hypothetical protein